jgi:acetylornithine deacetylase/succinyl-diaminopimelate desuccinylase-like protein
MRAATLLENVGLAVERHPVPEEVVRANGMISAVNLVIRKRFGDGPTIALNAHCHVVPPLKPRTKVRPARKDTAAARSIISSNAAG